MNLLNYCKNGFLVLLMLFFGGRAVAQADTSFKQLKLSYPAYLKMVGAHNLGYAAEKFKVSIAQADVWSAKVFPDPELSFSAGDHGQRRMKMGYEISSGLSYTLELGGKRRARINLANREAELAQLLLDDYFRNLRVDATAAYLNAIKEKELLRVKMSSYEMMKRLSSSDSIRLKLGAITEVDARQSRLEAASQLNEVFEQEANWKAAVVNLKLFSGSKQQGLFYQPEADMKKLERIFDLQELILNAQNRRTDLLAALKSNEISLSLLKLAKASRTLDLGLSLGLASNSVVANAVAPTPSSTNVTIGFSIPLKFSNQNQGALKSARYGVQQAEVLYQQTELQIQTEVTQAYYNYLASRKQVAQFGSGMLMDAQKVLDGKVYSYKRGETSLLEVLTAQRTFNEVRQRYLETLNVHGNALLELERAAGIWDIEF
jgi:cobalt-zinc-cadmium efflux system outer membrane protein